MKTKTSFPKPKKRNFFSLQRKGLKINKSFNALNSRRLQMFSGKRGK